MTKPENDEIETLAKEICSELETDSWCFDNPDYGETTEQHEDRKNYYRTIAKLCLRKITSREKRVAERIFDDIFGIIKYLKTKPFQNMEIDDYLGTLEISIKDLQKEASCG